jgi:hypothetical protein
LPDQFEKVIQIGMKRIPAFRLLALFSFMITSGLHASQIESFPGTTYYDGPEQLTGKLIFISQHYKPKGDFDLPVNGPAASSIYEFDLQQKKLHKLADSPNGILTVSRDGNTFCVVHQFGIGQESRTNVFIYSKSSGLSRTVHLESPPGRTAAFSGHIFIEVGENMFHQRLVDYDIAKDLIRQIELPDASKWEYQDYDRIHASPGQTNILHFQYNGFGKRLAEGKDYPTGIYSLDINTGAIRPFLVGSLAVDRDDDSFWFKTFEGNCISFSGGDGAPFNGFKLVSTDWSYVGSDEIVKDDKENNIKILHQFSKLEAALKSTGEYQLIQTSPDLHYAWVKTGEGGTYYLVDVSTGKTRVLFKTDESVTMVRWVQ